MLRLKTYINERGIGQVKVVNSGKQIYDSVYEYEVYTGREGTEDRKPTATVWHDRDQGAARLAEHAFREVADSGGLDE